MTASAEEHRIESPAALLATHGSLQSNLTPTVESIWTHWPHIYKNLDTSISFDHLWPNGHSTPNMAIFNIFSQRLWPEDQGPPCKMDMSLIGSISAIWPSNSRRRWQIWLQFRKLTQDHSAPHAPWDTLRSQELPEIVVKRHWICSDLVRIYRCN